VKKLKFTKSGTNLTLNLDCIKIKDFDKWSQMKTDEDLTDVTKDIVNDVVEEKKLDFKN
jgi:hypothetical protein